MHIFFSLKFRFRHAHGLEAVKMEAIFFASLPRMAIFYGGCFLVCFCAVACSVYVQAHTSTSKEAERLEIFAAHANERLSSIESKLELLTTETAKDKWLHHAKPHVMREWEEMRRAIRFLPR